MDGDPVLQANYDRNAADPQTKAFLDELWEVCKRHDLILDRMSPEEPLLIRDLTEDDETWLRSAVDTTREDFQGLP